MTTIGSIYSKGRPLRRLLVVLLLLAGLTPSLLAAQGGVEHVSSSTYDVSGVLRVGVLDGWLVPSASSLLSDPLERSASQSVGVRSASTTPGARSNATEAASGAADDLTRVGRWMSPEEHAAMVRTGEVQVGAGGTTYVANPADVNAFTPNRFPSNYVEFDVPTSSLRPGQPGWGQIPSPDSVWGRLAAKQGVSVQSPVPACNIVLVATRSSC